ncbi:MAG TPA: HAMP domain-containing sensor histidine kinase [Candidatus Binatia bacterium]|nr:HAMP domain-containing sensor histidine kinase [Candidatus Binatia bacterium]
MAPASSDTRYDVRPYVREHLQRAFGWSRRVVASVLVFAWLFTWLGVYRIDLRVFTTILVVAFGTHAVLQRLFVRVRNEERFLFLDAFLKCLLVTATLWVWGGSEAGLAAIFYVIPIVYHSVTRSRRQIFLTANVAATLWAALLALEYFEVLPFRTVFGFGRPPTLTYVGLALGLFLELNVIASVCDAVSRTFAETAKQVERANAALAEKNRALERKQNELEERVAERTRSLAHANHALAEKARALEERQEDLKAFIYAVTHDLKSPLTNILLGADIVLDREGVTLTAAGREELVRVARMAAHGEAMIQDLLGLFQITSEPEEPGWVDLDALVGHALDTLSSEIARKAIEVEVAPLPSVWGQAGKLRHVVANLLGNAVKYVERGRGRIEVRGVAEDGSVVVCVADNGIGIPAHYQKAIFELFGRVPGQRAVVDGQAVDGTGVGLSIVKRIVEAHGGTVWVESAAGAGARFFVRLPAAPGADGDGRP